MFVSVFRFADFLRFDSFLSVSLRTNQLVSPVHECRRLQESWAEMLKNRLFSSQNPRYVQQNLVAHYVKFLRLSIEFSKNRYLQLAFRILEEKGTTNNPSAQYSNPH